MLKQNLPCMNTFSVMFNSFCSPMVCNPPVSSVQGIFLASMPEWVAKPSSTGSSWPRDWTPVSCVFCIVRQTLYHWATWKAQSLPYWTQFGKEYSSIYMRHSLPCNDNFIIYLYTQKSKVYLVIKRKGLPWWLSGKESACNAGDVGSNPGSGKYYWERNGNPLQYSLAWETPWKEEPAGYSPWVGQDSATKPPPHEKGTN